MALYTGQDLSLLGGASGGGGSLAVAGSGISASVSAGIDTRGYDSGFYAGEDLSLVPDLSLGGGGGIYSASYPGQVVAPSPAAARPAIQPWVLIAGVGLIFLATRRK